MKPKTSFTEICSRSCSCSYKDRIPEETFIKILKGDLNLLDEWLPHIICFFNETPIDWVCGVMKQLNLKIEDLYKINIMFPSPFKSKRLGEIDEYFKCNVRTFE